MPRLPESLQLDSHTRHFFSRAEHSAPVDARFKLDHPIDPELKDMVFIGRVTRFFYDALHIVMQEFSGDSEVDARSPILMSALAMPFHNTNIEERANATSESSSTVEICALDNAKSGDTNS